MMRFLHFAKQNIHALLVLLGVLVGSASIALFVHNKDAEMRQALLTQAQSIDLALGWSSMYENILVNQSAENAIRETPELALHRTRIHSICAVYANCRAVYLMRKNVKKQIYFLVDSSPKSSELYIVPGTIYSEASPAVHKAFATQKLATDGPVTDRWGVWVSALVPHLLPDKSVVVVGIDIEAKDWNKTLFKSAIVPAISTLVFLALMMFYNALWRAKSKYNQALEESHRLLLKLSNEDSLTGLPNRRVFEDRLTQMIASAARNHAKFAVFYLDLDKFKQVNDTLGHDAGDQLLREVAARFSQTLRAEDTIARLSGDEFAMLLPNIALEAHAALIAAKVIDTLAAPIIINGSPLSVTVSIGVVIFSEKWTSSHEITRAADEAMYVAKKAGADRYCFFNEAGK